MEQIKRYIYAVTQKLPQKQRKDIERELESLIEDMVEERVHGGEEAELATEKVLLEMGNPNALAEKYRGNQRYLISPDFFDFYLTVMKVVMISIIVSLTVVFAIEFILDPMEVTGHFFNYMNSMFLVAVQGFAWVTIAFALIEYAGIKLPKNRLESKKEWRPSQLPPIPDPKTVIKSSEPITSIIFSVLFLVLFTFSVQLLGLILFHEGQLFLSLMRKCFMATFHSFGY